MTRQPPPLATSRLGPEVETNVLLVSGNSKDPGQSQKLKNSKGVFP